MSVGRNDPCPCGSGLKYKKCCLNKHNSSATPQSDLSSFDLVSMIAYAGKIGRRRAAWCKEFIVWRAEVETVMEAAQKRKAETKAEDISCFEGCWYCCTQFIGASLQECEAIIYWLYQHRDTFDVFVKQYPVWRKRVRGHEELFQRVMQAGNIQSANPTEQQLRETFLEVTGEFAKLDIPCPFLVEDKCSIYPVRPFACVSQVSLSPPEYCRQSVEEIPFLLIVDRTPPLPAYCYGSEDRMTVGAAAQLVYEILQNGFTYLDTVPGMSGIETEAYNDPEIAALLRENIARLK